MQGKINQGSLPSVLALAYLGDARHALFVRRMLVRLGISKSGTLSDAAKRFVSAEAQARCLEKIIPHLSEDELSVCRRARNSTHLNRPKHQTAEDYRAATAFEALLGMLDYLGDEARISELLEIAHTEDDENDQKN